MRTATPNRWAMLAVSIVAQMGSTVYLNSVPFLIPHLHLDLGLSLVEAGFLASAPIVGTMLTLIAWGAVVDAIGERRSLAIGMTILTVSAAAAALSSSSFIAMGVFLLLGGLGGASINSASGRLIVGWFPPERRGFAMGVRQTAQPLGVGIAAAVIPNLVDAYGLRPSLLFIAALCGVATVLSVAFIVDPPRVSRAEARELGHFVNPYRRDDRLWRIHGASVLLVVPQFVIWTYALLWLITVADWSTAAASAAIAAVQVLGALARIGAGTWSDRARSRLRPMRTIAYVTCATMLALGLVEGTALAVGLILFASIITVSPNGLAFTSIAEIGGPGWAGRVMGAHNTGQFLVAAAVGPLFGAAIPEYGYAWAFGIAAIFPLIAAFVIPVRTEHTQRA